MFPFLKIVHISKLVVPVLLLAVPSFRCNLLEYQATFASQGRSINFKMVQIHDDQRNAFSSVSVSAIKLIGETIVAGRERTSEVWDFIDSFGDDLTSREESCIEAASIDHTAYAKLFGDDVSQCSKYLNYWISEQYSEETGAALAAANRLATATIGGSLQVLEEESDPFELVGALHQRRIELEEAWLLSQRELESIAIRKAKAYEDALTNLELCQAQSVLFFNYTIAYVKDQLEACLREE